MRSVPEPPRFFDAGLQFACTRCGACCTGAPGIVSLTLREAAAIARRFRLPLAEFRRAYCRDTEKGLALVERRDGRCVFYNKGCTIYHLRPMQCRTYPFWARIMRTPEAWTEEALGCPGIGHGKQYTRREIVGLIRLSPI